MRIMKSKSFLVLASLAIGLSPVAATTVIPPTFDQLVGQAEVIFQGSVNEVRSVWSGEGAQRHIDSYVTFQVEDTVKGKPGASFTIRLLGGTVDGETMEVTDSPKFKVGDRDILFVEHNGEQFVPLVGIMHGRFRVQRDEQTGRDFVTTGEGEPVRDPSKLGREEESATVAEALSPADFKSQIQTHLTNHPVQ
jgi:hypothetical protein